MITVMIDLAKEYSNNKFISLKEISKKENISLKYLEKLILNFKNTDYFITSRGVEGGYKLKHPPEYYSIKDILLKAEGNLDVVECISNEYNCPKKENCSTYKVWKELNDISLGFLNSKTLKDFI